MTPEHPVTLGDLYVIGEPEGYLYRNQGWDYRPATLADLVSALRAEGILVVEKVDGEWPQWALGAAAGYADYYEDALAALAEAQPITDETPKDPWDYDP